MSFSPESPRTLAMLGTQTCTGQASSSACSWQCFSTGELPGECSRGHAPAALSPFSRALSKIDACGRATCMLSCQVSAECSDLGASMHHEVHPAIIVCRDADSGPLQADE